MVEKPGLRPSLGEIVMSSESSGAALARDATVTSHSLADSCASLMSSPSGSEVTSTSIPLGTLRLNMALAGASLRLPRV